MIIETNWLRIIPGCAALTVWPFIFILPGRWDLVPHERFHLEQQWNEHDDLNHDM